MHKGQFDRLLDLFERAVVVAERWADAEYPIINATAEEAEFYRQGDTPAQPQTPEQYKEFPGRFEKRFKAAHPES